VIHDHDKEFILKTALLNNRLKAYRYYVNMALEHGYLVEPLETFYKHCTEEGKHFVLRHDVDHPGKSTRKMFECEKVLGVKSTYYFRKSTVDKPLIDEMIAAGFEVGFHFETVADYIEENKITDKRDIDFEGCKARLKRDIEQFEEMIGHKINSICSHGAPANTRLCISNNSITEAGIPDNCTVEFEAYSKKMYKCVDCHIMDGRLRLNYGFSYKDTPVSAIEDNKNNIVFLTHPNHWWLSGVARIKVLGALVLGKTTSSTERSFKRVSL